MDLFAFIELLDGEKENRSGVTRYNQGLDANSLNKTATGIAAIQNAAEQRIELVARLFAEGVKKLFSQMHDTVRRHSEVGKAETVRLRGKWIDIELIIQIAKCYKNGSIVLIGLNENNPNIDKLNNLNNIYFLGMKSREEVPEYISNFDVCLMPFNRTEIGRGLLPLKMFEYLALGKPVVATSSEVLKQFEEVLYLADDEDSFLKHIENAITDNNRENSERRRAYSLKYSWENRVNEYLSAIQESIKSE